MPATIIASVLTALITAVLAGLVTFAVQERKLREPTRRIWRRRAVEDTSSGWSSEIRVVTG